MTKFAQAAAGVVLLACVSGCCTSGTEAQCSLGASKCVGHLAYNCGPDGTWVVTDCAAIGGMTCVELAGGAHCEPAASPDGGARDSGRADRAQADAGPNDRGVSDGGGTDRGAPDGGAKASITALPHSNDTVHACTAHAMSTSGTIVAGTCEAANGEMEAVIWVNGVLSNLGHMGTPQPGVEQNSFATAASNSGVVLGNEGYADLEPMAYYRKDDKWTAILHTETGEYAQSAIGVSLDGSIVIGNTADRKDNEGTMESFKGGYSFDLQSGKFLLATSSFFLDRCKHYHECALFFTGLTDDGLVISGTDMYASAETNGQITIPVYYQLSGSVPPVRLPLPAGYPNGSATGIARDGSIVTGSAFGTGMPVVAVYWDASFAVHQIGSLGPDTENLDTAALAASNGGERIVGISNRVAFIHTRAGGLMPLADYLSALGLGEVLKDWELHKAGAITPDGKRIAGSGRYKAEWTAFVVDLP